MRPLTYIKLGCIPFSVKNTYTIKEAQRGIAAMVSRSKELLETMEILADPKAMDAIRDAETGRGKVFAAKDLPE
jgi:hypothetical protein